MTAMLQSSEAQAVSTSYEQLKAEAARLRDKVAGQQEVIAAKDAVIAAKDALIHELTAARAQLLASRDAGAVQQQTSGVHLGAQKDEATPSHIASKRTALQSAASPQRSMRHRATASFEPPLEQDSILQFILDFVGVRDYYFTASVSRRWCGRYLSFCRGLRETHWTAAVSAPHRLMLAFADGLTEKIYDDEWEFAVAVVEQSADPVGILQMCRAKGLSWDLDIPNAVAGYGNVTMLQQLIAFGCPWTPEGLSANCASQHPHIAIPMLTWICATLKLTPTEKQVCMAWAGVWNNIETITW
jgi:hypothetical protein